MHKTNNDIWNDMRSKNNILYAKKQLKNICLTFL